MSLRMQSHLELLQSSNGSIPVELEDKFQDLNPSDHEVAAISTPAQVRMSLTEEIQ